MGGQLAELVRFRELVRNLVLRDIRSRYKGSSLGFLWSLANPLIQMTVLWFVIPRIAKFPASRADFPLFLLCGLFPWVYLANALNECTTSVIQNATLVRKVYFPREVLPIGIVISGGIHFLLAMGVLMLLLVTTGHLPTIAWTVLPVLVGLQILLLAGAGLIASCGNTRFRDVQWVVSVGVMIGFYASPVFYPVETMIHGLGGWGGLYLLNPMAVLIDAYRSVLLHGTFPQFAGLGLAAAETVLLLFVGLRLYRRFGPYFAEYV